MNLDDPKLTAYALGEIIDPSEISEVETWLAAHAEGRAYVTDIQEMAAFLSEKLHAAASVELTAEQRDAILEQTKIIPLPTNRKPWSIIALAALAACLAAAPLLPWAELLRLRDSEAPTVAINDTPMTLQMPRDLDFKPTASNETGFGLSLKRQPQTIRRASSSDTIEKKLKDAREKFDLAEEGISIAPSTPPDRFSDRGGGLPASEDTLPDTSSGPDAPTGRQDASPTREEPDPASSQTAIAGFTEGWAGGGKAEGSGSLKANLGRANMAAKETDYSVDKNASPSGSFNTEAYDAVTENDFLSAKENPLSTFSIDVDTASYANVRRFLNDGQLPPKGAVRIEEMLNYFLYDYAPPTGDAPFSTNLEVADCPWQPAHRLVRIGLKGREIPVAERKAANLVFLIDVSGSMDEPNKLPLLKQSLRLLVDQLGENDRVALAIYAGNSGLVLPSTSNKEAIRTALENLQSGGSTNGASGIQLAYEQAAAHFQKDGVNRVILATDGDFNVGVTNQSDLVDLITQKAKSGVFLSVLGFGTGNVKDSTMEKLADKGNGNYAYIDSLREGKKVLVEQMGGTLVTIAKDVKIQVEFNPNVVASYRLIGYENRTLKKEDFNDDRKDAGEIGSGHTVTALYEIIPANAPEKTSPVDALKYGIERPATGISTEMLTVKLRYKEPTGDVSKKLEFPLNDDGKKLAGASSDFRFATAVAEFGQLLRQSENRQLASWEAAISRADDAKGEDRGGYRAEFIELVKKARDLSRRNDS